MIKAILFIAVLLQFSSSWAQSQSETSLNARKDSVNWISVSTDSGIVHAAIAIPVGQVPFPAIIILHGTHGFSQEYVELAQSFEIKVFVGIAVCCFR